MTDAYEWIAHVVFWATIISILLPPVEVFDAYPKFKKIYSLIVILVHNYAALNLRGKIAAAYQDYSARKNGTASAGLPKLGG